MKKRLGTVFAVVFGLVVLLGTAGAVSRFVGRNERPKAYECKVVLRDILWAQRAFRDQHGRYAESFGELRFKLPEKKRYTYAVEKLGGADFIARCEANLDEDEGLDVWTISAATGEAKHAMSDE